MTKLLTKTVGGLVAAAALVAAASPADAQYRYRHHRSHSGTAITAGIIGLGIGAAIASSNRGYYGGYYDPYYRGSYYDPYYGGGYYDGYYGGGYYGYRPHRRHCVTRRTWDPYYRRYVRVRYC